MRVRAVLISLSLYTALATPALAGLVEVEQTVFGMDCAPCAYSIEQGVKGLDGVREVNVSLNQGLAHVRFAPGSQARLDQLRAVIRDAGFTPKTATVVVSGRLAQRDGEAVLVTDGGERFRLQGVSAAKARSDRPSTPVTVTGRVGADAGEPATLVVSEITDASSGPRR